MDCASKGNINEDMKDDSQVKRLLTLAKENMVQDYKRKFDEEINKRNEELKKEYEEQYRVQIEEYAKKIEECNSKIAQQDTDIESYKREFIIAKDEIKTKDAKVDELVEETKLKESENEALTETNNLNYKRLFEFYKAKT